MQKGKGSWQSEVKDYHKVTVHNTPYTKIFWENMRGWLPLLRWETTGNWAESRLYIEYLVGQIFPEWYGISRSFMAWSGASSWTGGILFSDSGLPSWVKSFLSLCCDLRVKSGLECSFPWPWSQGQVRVWVFFCWLWSQGQVRGRVFFSMTLAFGIR